MNSSKCTNTILMNALSSDVSYTWQDWVHAGKRLLVHEISQAFPVLRVWWHRKTSRRHLAMLEARLLDDIGLSADQARCEYEKPFWVK